MKKYIAEDLAKQVRVILDRNMASDQLLADDDVDTLTQDEIITACLVPSIRFIECNAPSYLLDGGDVYNTFDAANIAWKESEGNGMGDITLPSDFMRLLTFQMSDWERPGKIITETDPEYVLQSSPYRGIKGNPIRPIVAIVNYSDGLHLELYSCEGGVGVTILKSSYICTPSLQVETITEGEETTEQTVVLMCPKLEQAILYYAAYLASISMGDTNVSNALVAEAYKQAEIPTGSNE